MAEETYWKHRKRGTTYREISRTGVLQASTPLMLRDGDILVTYENEEGQLFHRLLEEFEDGRFVKVETAKPVAYGETVLSDLLVRANKIGMAPEQAEGQRRSFVYGNLVIDNPNITREMVDEAAQAAMIVIDPLSAWGREGDK